MMWLIQELWWVLLVAVLAGFALTWLWMVGTAPAPTAPARAPESRLARSKPANDQSMPTAAAATAGSAGGGVATALRPANAPAEEAETAAQPEPHTPNRPGVAAPAAVANATAGAATSHGRSHPIPDDATGRYPQPGMTPDTRATAHQAGSRAPQPEPAEQPWRPERVAEPMEPSPHSTGYAPSPEPAAGHGNPTVHGAAPRHLGNGAAPRHPGGAAPGHGAGTAEPGPMRRAGGAAAAGAGMAGRQTPRTSPQDADTGGLPPIPVRGGSHQPPQVPDPQGRGRHRNAHPENTGLSNPQAPAAHHGSMHDAVMRSAAGGGHPDAHVVDAADPAGQRPGPVRGRSAAAAGASVAAAAGRGGRRARVASGAVKPLAGGVPPSGYPVKGDTAALMYYTPGTPGYDKVTPDVCFDSEVTAQQAGFRHRNVGGF